MTEPTIKLPNFFILGAGRSGTTTLYFILRDHPEIFLPTPKEPSFFSEPFQVIRGEGANFFDLADADGSEGVVLFLYINFAISDRDIRGYIAMLMDLPSLAALKELIGEFIARVMGDEA